MKNFEYEWWLVEITDEAGTLTWEFKGKDKEHIVRQINKAVERTNSEENLKKGVWMRQARILSVNWDTLRLDRIGYQRLS